MNNMHINPARRPIIRRIPAFAAALCLSVLLSAHGAGAVTFAELRALGGDKPVELSGTLDGVIVSDWRSDNVAHNPALDHNRVDLGENLRTAVIESLDGRYGFCLKFESIYGNRLCFGDMVRLDLGGCLLVREESPERYTIAGLTPEKVLAVRHGGRVPVKQRRISELAAEDLNTFVTLTGLEFAKKSGAYINVCERYVQTTDLNRFMYCRNPFVQGPTENADCWARLLLDDGGSWIYMLVNSTCLWRRNNGGVPQGRGSISGLVVHDSLKRYGAALGDFSIRPLGLSAFSLSAEAESAYTTIASWEWDYNAHAELSLEKTGIVRCPKPGMYSGDRILAETGQGYLWTDSGASLSLGDEYDARHSFDGWKLARMTGSRSNAALRLDCDGTAWAGKSIFVETSTAGLSSGELLFMFSFVEGIENSLGSCGYPVEWKLSFSTDGKTWTELPQICRLHPMAWTNIRHGKRLVQVHSEAAIGFPEYCFPLPDFLLGQEKLLLRLSPCSDVCAVVPEHYDAPFASGLLSGTAPNPVTIRLGTVVLKCLKK